MSDEVARRIEYNRKENERYFNAIMLGVSLDMRRLFQVRLLDAMFSVIEVDDFKRLCIKSIATIGNSAPR